MIGFAVEQYLQCVAASQDAINVSRIYVDMAGDLIAGVMLSEIVRAHLPGYDGEAVDQAGDRWVVMSQDDWWSVCRMTPKQARRARKVLEDKGLIVTAVYQHHGAPTTHLRVNWDKFGRQYAEAARTQVRPARARIAPSPAPDTQPSAQNDKPADSAVYEFLTAECGIWPAKARQLADSGAELDQAARWWAILADDDNVRNQAAVLVHHLEHGQEPPELLTDRQRRRCDRLLSSYVWEDDEDESGGDL